MKSWIVNVSLVLAVCCSCYLFTVKFATPGDADKLMAGLSGARKYLPPGSSLSILNLVPPPRTNVELRPFFPDFVNFIFAPARIIKSATTLNDTVLVLLPASSPSSLRDSVTRNTTIIWENTDSQYHYILIH